METGLAGILTSLGAVGGALAVRAFDLVAGRPQRQSDDASKIRGELRADLSAARQELEKSEAAYRLLWAEHQRVVTEFARWKLWLGVEMMGPDDPTARRGPPPAKPE